MIYYEQYIPTKIRYNLKSNYNTKHVKNKGGYFR